MKIAIRSIALALLLGGIAAAGAAAAASPQPAPAMVDIRHNVMGEGIGLLGYDPVSYFPEGGGAPRKGLIGITAEQDGVTYRFATEASRDLFTKSPAKYLPAYGGWCAWAVSEINKRVDVDPESFAVRDGRLYLFYRDPKLDTRALWQPKAEQMIARADANWPALSH